MLPFSRYSQSKWQRSLFDRPKRSTRAAFLTTYLMTPKDIATRRGEDISETQLYHRANLLQQTKIRHIAYVCRIIKWKRVALMEHRVFCVCFFEYFSRISRLISCLKTLVSEMICHSWVEWDVELSLSENKWTTTNVAIAKRLRVSCVHKVSTIRAPNDLQNSLEIIGNVTLR